MKHRQVLFNWVPRLILGGAFVFAGVLKILDPAKFALDLGNYRIVPPAMINVVAVLLPWIELVAGSFVLLGIWLRAASMVLASMTLMFVGVVLSALARGLNIDCGCFGTVGGTHVGLVTLVIDSVLLTLGFFLVRQCEHSPVGRGDQSSR